MEMDYENKNIEYIKEYIRIVATTAAAEIQCRCNC